MTKMIQTLTNEQTKFLTEKQTRLQVDEQGRFLVIRGDKSATGRTARMALEEWAKGK